jgi:hypothetical protein
MAFGGRPGTEEDRSRSSLQRTTDWIVANRSVWLRGLLMLALFFVFWLVKLVVGLIALFQFGSLLLTGQTNSQLRVFGASLALYSHDIVAYLTCASERLPFPFTEWPRPASDEDRDWDD